MKKADQNEETKQEVTDLPTEVKPIKCPRCGSMELSFVTHYQKAILLKVFSVICALIAGYFFVMGVFPALIAGKSPDLFPIVIALLIPTLIFWIVALLQESKTHVEAICRNCGHIWLLN